jgi:hypothetical protein
MHAKILSGYHLLTKHVKIKYKKCKFVFIDYKSWSVIIRGAHRLRLFERGKHFELQGKGKEEVIKNSKVNNSASSRVLFG